MDNYLIKAEVVKTEVWIHNPHLFVITYEYTPHGAGTKTGEYYLPKTLSPPIVGSEIEIRIS